MALTIQDDFWAAAQAMPEKQRAPFIYALVAYGYTGEEPKGSPAWLPTFLVIRDRIEMSKRASERGRAMAEARWRKRDASASGPDDAAAPEEDDGGTMHEDVRQHMPEQMRKHMHEHEQQHMHEHVHEHDAESESESEITPKPPYAEIVGHLNDRTGSAFRVGSMKTRQLIRARMAEGFTAEDFRAVVDCMADEWGDDPKMVRYLRPETLFGTKFEGYRELARAREAKAQAVSAPRPVNSAEAAERQLADVRERYEVRGNTLVPRRG